MAFSGPVAVLAETVGKMTAVQTQVRKAGSGVMNIGSGVSMGDRLSSNATGLGMIVFKDQSSAKLGPNSVLTIDDFVYGGGGGGSFGISMDRGVSRFYGGQVSKKGQMKVTTPHVILGVRGGIVETKVEGGRTVGILRAGKLTCFLNDQVQVITKPGYACVSDGGSLQVVKFPNALEVLDSPARIAGTGVPGQRGPGIWGGYGLLQVRAFLHIGPAKAETGSCPHRVVAARLEIRGFSVPVVNDNDTTTFYTASCP
jgi:hypothetical protein